ncbi:hypothetical protein K3495_g15934 [Podosphaera aphanis]|nr:hypothetical protein K3495_g15934 [Podosphaera aphanis]
MLYQETSEVPPDFKGVVDELKQKLAAEISKARKKNQNKRKGNTKPSEDSKRQNIHAVEDIPQADPTVITYLLAPLQPTLCLNPK